MPSNLVTSVHIDNLDESRIWTGSKRSGLTRFDGKGFYTFTIQDGLPSNHVQDITQKNNGDLVIACYKAGVSIYDGKRFQLYDQGLDDKRVISIAIGPESRIWAGTESAGIGVLNGSIFQMIRDTDGLGHNELFLIDAMESAIKEELSDEYKKLIRLYFLELQNENNEIK